MAETNKDLAYQELLLNKRDKIHISFSEYSLFNQCGHRHLLEKHLGIYQQPASIHLFFGNSVHSSIENSIKEGWDKEKTVNFFDDNFSKAMMDNMRETNEFKTMFPHFLNHGKAILETLSIDNILSEYELVSVEEPLYENIHANFYFKGFIDLVLRHKVTKRYLILDWKTSTMAWDVNKKLSDSIFLGQMRFYKYFWGRKNNINLEDIDCRYVVLNRLKKKNDMDSYPAPFQIVDVNSTLPEVKSSLKNMALTIKKIHIEKSFPKIKYIGSEKMGCIFCPLKGGLHPLCDSNPEQYKSLLLEHKK